MAIIVIQVGKFAFVCPALLRYVAKVRHGKLILKQTMSCHGVWPIFVSHFSLSENVNGVHVNQVILNIYKVRVGEVITCWSSICWSVGYGWLTTDRNQGYQRHIILVPPVIVLCWPWPLECVKSYILCDIKVLIHNCEVYFTFSNWIRETKSTIFCTICKIMTSKL